MTSENKIRALPSPAPLASGRRLLCIRVFTIVLVLLLSGGSSLAYSVLTHEEIVDLLWTDEIRPLLLKRFPGLSEEQLKEAHAYAYGGAVIQDLGYYPLGGAESGSCVGQIRRRSKKRENSRSRIPAVPV